MSITCTRWKCETCGCVLSEPVETSENGYFCCFASMTFLGVEPSRDSRSSPERAETGTGSGRAATRAAVPEGQSPNPYLPSEQP